MKNFSIFIIVLIAVLSISCENRKDEKLVTALKKEVTLLNERVSLLDDEKKQVEFNKKLVVNFFQEVFGDLKPEAIKNYVDEKYIQHDPFVEDGRDALIGVAEKWAVGKSPHKLDIKRVFAEKDLVFIHTRNENEDAELLLMHVFRVENRKIAEHWMTVQKVPENPKNDNTMF